MKNVLSFLLLIISMNLNAQNDLVLEFSDYHDSLSVGHKFKLYKVTGSDSIVLSYYLDYFENISIYRNGKLTFSFNEISNNEELINIEVIKDDIVGIFDNYYIFKVVEYPGVLYKYAVLKTENSGIKFLGLTETCSAMIFGDIDSDGIMEIGGYNRAFENGFESHGSYSEIYDKYFRIFEVGENFVNDSKLENSLKHYFIDRLKRGENYSHEYVFQKPIFNSIGESNYENRIIILKTVEISESMLKNIPVDKLRIMRNEIFARHGYIFKSQDLKEFYSKFDWYNPQHENVTDKLSEIEKHNIEIIYSIEKK